MSRLEALRKALPNYSVKILRSNWHGLDGDVAFISTRLQPLDDLDVQIVRTLEVFVADADKVHDEDHYVKIVHSHIGRLG